MYLLYYKHRGLRQKACMIGWDKSRQWLADGRRQRWIVIGQVCIRLINMAHFSMSELLCFIISPLPLYIKWQRWLHGQPTLFPWRIGKPIKNHVNFGNTGNFFTLVSKMANYAVSVYMLSMVPLFFPISLILLCPQTELRTMGFLSMLWISNLTFFIKLWGSWSASCPPCVLMRNSSGSTSQLPTSQAPTDKPSSFNHHCYMVIQIQIPLPTKAWTERWLWQMTSRAGSRVVRSESEARPWVFQSTDIGTNVGRQPSSTSLAIRPRAVNRTEPSECKATTSQSWCSRTAGLS